MTQRPIAEKYCEGKLKRTSKDESKEPEIAPREQNGIGTRRGWFQSPVLTRGAEQERRKGGAGGRVEPVATGCLKLLLLREEKPCRTSELWGGRGGGRWGTTIVL